MANDALLVEILATVLERLALVSVHGADLYAERQRVSLHHMPVWLYMSGTHVVISLVPQLLAAIQRLCLEQISLPAVHTHAVIWLKIPASWALDPLLCKRTTEQTNCDESERELHFFFWRRREVVVIKRQEYRSHLQTGKPRQ